MIGIGLLVLCVGALYVLLNLVKYQRIVNSIQNIPGCRALFNPRGIFGILLDTPGMIPDQLFGQKHHAFEEFGADIHSLVICFPAEARIYLADAAAIKEVTSHRARFPKPVTEYKPIAYFGDNVSSVEGEESKRLRKLAAPAFSESNIRLVWDESIRIVLDMFDNAWGNKSIVTIDQCVEMITQPLTLLIIRSAGFGQRISWEDDEVVPPGHHLTFKDALLIVTSNVGLKLIFDKFLVPSWALNLSPRLGKIRLAFDELKQYMHEMIEERQGSERKEQGFDLLSGFLDEDDEERVKPLESGFIGNIFVFLIAGHETAAHTLAFAFGLLALYQEEQEILYQHIQSVLHERKLPTYEDMPLLTQSMAVFYETLRMFPLVVGVPKQSAEDTTLTTKNSQGEKIVVPIAKGTRLTINVPGLHYNPRYWSDPHSFKPSRFLKSDWPRDAFLPFSAGSRACLGRKFGETEGIAILTMIVSRYKINIKEEPQFAGESFQARKDRILTPNHGITMSPLRMPLTFILRTSLTPGN